MLASELTLLHGGDMNMVAQDSAEMGRRLDHLESELKWWKILTSFCFLTLAFLLLAGARASNVSDELRAKRFILIGPNGTIVGEFSAKQGSSVLALSNAKGEPRVMLHHSYDTPSGLLLLDGKQTRADLSMRLDDSVALDLFDKQGKLRTSIGIRADGTADFSR